MTQKDTTVTVPQVLTPAEVADLLACSRNHVYRLMSSGALPAIDISVPGSKSTKSRIRVSDLNEYLAGIEVIVEDGPAFQ